MCFAYRCASRNGGLGVTVARCALHNDGLRGAMDSAYRWHGVFRVTMCFAEPWISRNHGLWRNHGWTSRNHGLRGTMSRCALHNDGLRVTMDSAYRWHDVFRVTICFAERWTSRNDGVGWSAWRWS